MWDSKYSINCAAYPKIHETICEDQPAQSSEDIIAELKAELKQANEMKDHWYKQYNEYLLEAAKYKHAFKAVMEELKK